MNSGWNDNLWIVTGRIWWPWSCREVAITVWSDHLEVRDLSPARVEGEPGIRSWRWLIQERPERPLLPVLVFHHHSIHERNETLHYNLPKNVFPRVERRWMKKKTKKKERLKLLYTRAVARLVYKREKGRWRGTRDRIITIRNCIIFLFVWIRTEVTDVLYIIDLVHHYKFICFSRLFHWTSSSESQTCVERKNHTKALKATSHENSIQTPPFPPLHSSPHHTWRCFCSSFWTCLVVLCRC